MWISKFDFCLEKWNTLRTNSKQIKKKLQGLGIWLIQNFQHKESLSWIFNHKQCDQTLDRDVLNFAHVISRNHLVTAFFLPMKKRIKIENGVRLLFSRRLKTDQFNRLFQQPVFILKIHWRPSQYPVRESGAKDCGRPLSFTVSNALQTAFSLSVTEKSIT